jgi:hypothetical protein
MAHAVYNSDNVSATTDGAKIVSAKYMGADGNTATEIDNANVVKITALVDGEREVWTAVTPSASDSISDVVIVTTPESFKEAVTKADKNLENFTNAAGSTIRGFHFTSGDTFSASAEAFASTPSVGDTVSLTDGTKMAVGDSATGTKIGVIIDKTELPRYTLYGVKVKL